jgi:hypothetical protein
MTPPSRRKKEPSKYDLFESKPQEFIEWKPQVKQEFKTHPEIAGPPILKKIPDGYMVMNMAIQKKMATELHCALYVEHHMGPECVLFDVWKNEQDGGFYFSVLMPDILMPDKKKK